MKTELPVTFAKSDNYAVEPELPFATVGRGTPPELADDILISGEAIRKFLGMKDRAQLYRIKKKFFPIFRIGGKLCARKSDLRQWIDGQIEYQTPSGKPLAGSGAFPSSRWEQR